MGIQSQWKPSGRNSSARPGSSRGSGVRPAAVAGAGPLPRRDGELLAARADGARAVARLDEAAALQGQPVTAALGVVRLPDGREVAGPGEVEGESVRVRRVGVAVQGERLERFVHGDPERADGEVHPVVAEGVGGADGVQSVAGAEGRVGVHDAGVGVDTEAGDEQGAALVVEDVEDAPVVHVAVTADVVLHRERRLVHGVLVERDGPVV